MYIDLKEKQRTNHRVDQNLEKSTFKGDTLDVITMTVWISTHYRVCIISK